MNIARAAGWTGAETDVYAADATPSFWQSPQMLTVGIGHLVLLERLRVQSRLFKIRNAPTKAASTEVKGRLPLYDQVQKSLPETIDDLHP